MPRFNAQHYPANLALLPAYISLAERQGCTPAQLALAWVLTQGDHIIAIPGTQNLAHLKQNITTNYLELDAHIVVELNDLINQHTVQGARYSDKAQATVTTERFSEKD